MTIIFAKISLKTTKYANLINNVWLEILNIYEMLVEHQILQEPPQEQAWYNDEICWRNRPSDLGKRRSNRFKHFPRPYWKFMFVGSTPSCHNMTSTKLSYQPTITNLPTPSQTVTCVKDKNLYFRKYEAS